MMKAIRGIIVFSLHVSYSPSCLVFIRDTRECACPSILCSFGNIIEISHTSSCETYSVQPFKIYTVYYQHSSISCLSNGSMARATVSVSVCSRTWYRIVPRQFSYSSIELP